MNNNDVIEINLIDLMYGVLKKLPLIILVAFFCAALGTGYGAMKAREYNAQITDDMSDLTPEEEMAFEKLTEAQKTKIAAIDQQISENEKQIALQQNKLESTLIWNWNTPAAYRTTVKYLVVPTGDDENYNVLAILSAYQSGINAADFDKQLIDTLGLDVDVDAVRDLVWADISFQEELDGTPGTLSIQVRGKTEEDTKKMTELAKKYIDGLHKSFAISIAKHNLKFITEYDSKERLDWAENDKAACTLTISDKNRIIANLIEEKEKILFPNGREKKEEVKKSKKSLVDIKMIAIGGIVGAFIAVMVLAICYLMDGVLHDSSAVISITNAQDFCLSTNENISGNTLISWINKTKHKGKNIVPAGKISDVLTAYLLAMSEKVGGKSICFMGSNITDEQKLIISEINSKLMSKDIVICALENVLNNSEELTLLSKADLVVITEVENKSKTDILMANIDLCRRLDKKITCAFIQV